MSKDNNELVLKKINEILSKNDETELDINKMSDFFCIAVNNSINTAIDTNTMAAEVVSLDKFGSGIEVINYVESIKNDSILTPNFDALSKEAKEKLESGEWKLQESVKVRNDNNVEIVDQKGKIKCRVTLKKMMLPEYDAQLRSNMISNMQFKQIMSKLKQIEFLEKEQKRHMFNQDFVKPFFDARDRIKEAANCDNAEKAMAKIEQANQLLKSGMNAIKIDMQSSYAETLSFSNGYLGIEWIDKKIDKYIPNVRHYLENINTNKINSRLEDYSKQVRLMIAYYGLQMCILDAVGNTKEKEDALKSMNNYFEWIMNSTEYKVPLIDFLQEYYPYSKETMDFWITLKQQLQNSKQLLIDKNSFYRIELKKEDENE